MTKNLILILVLVVLVVVSAIQAVQLTSLKSNIAESSVKLGGGKSPQITTSSSTPASSLDELPGMVGGC